MTHHRRRWIWPLLVVLVWIVVGGPLGSFTGRLAEIQENENAAFLPSQAESTKVLDYQTQLIDPDIAMATVVWEFGEKADQQQLAAIDKQLSSLSDVDRVQTKQIVGPVPSEDGHAVQAQVPIDVSGDTDALGEGVQGLRDELGAPDGAHVYVTGMAGTLADLVDAFGGIDGVLLTVALVVVLVILLVVYRSPVLPLLVLVSAVLALGAAAAAVYALARRDLIDVNGQSQGILFILVVGAATDYALLLVSRYREELREHESRYAAMRVAYRGTFEPIVASGSTVILGLLCLLLSNLGSTKGLGPVGAVGIAGAMLATLTFLPAALLLLGRRAFWPFVPRLGSPHPESAGLWGRVSRMVGRHPRRTWLVVGVALLVCAGFATQFKDEGVSQTDTFLTEVDSVKGQEALARHFPAGLGSPTYVVAEPGQADEVEEVLASDPGVQPSKKSEPAPVGGKVLITAVLTDKPDSAAAEATVERLRDHLDAVSTDVLVGGNTAVALDTVDQSSHDRNTIIPIILAVIFVVLALLLRALVAPFLLIVANVLSFGATLGISALVFNHLLDLPGADPAVTLIGFVFLVALGIDYSIFLMTRVREESIRRGTRDGVLKGLSVTGGVITSAGIVLAATFSALGVLPILFLLQIAFIVAVGVLVDTIIVRTLLVPALAYDIGPAVWWPSRLARSGRKSPVDNPRHRA
ncbi:MAG: MMPL family transporter [Nocardioidaceae bacterium]